MLVLIAATLRTTHESHQEYIAKGMHLIESLSNSYGQASKEAREIIALERAVKTFANRSKDHPNASAGDDTWYNSFHTPWIGGETPTIATYDSRNMLEASCEETAEQSTFQELLGLDHNWNDMWNDFVLPGAL